MKEKMQCKRKCELSKQQQIYINKVINNINNIYCSNSNINNNRNTNSSVKLNKCNSNNKGKIK